MNSESRVPLVSAIITACNDRATIDQSVESFLHQFFIDREVIVVGDS